jgi:hypothetical protein
MGPSTHDRLAGCRTGSARIRTARSDALRRPPTQDDRHRARRRVAADLGVEGAEAQWPGEAKISGRVILAGAIADGPEGELFRADITEVVHTHLNDKASFLVIEWWTPTHGLRMIERE